MSSPRDTVDVGALGRQHDDGQHRLLPHPPADRQPVFARQHDIEHHQRRRPAADRLHHQLAIRQQPHLVPLASEKLGEQRPDVGVVFDQQKSRRIHRIS